MSYYTSNFYQNPQPYDSSDAGEPVPGWGLSSRPYSQPRVGVGAVMVKASQKAVMTSASKSVMPAVISLRDQATAIDEPGDIPWYYYIGGSVLVVGMAGFAYYRGWLG